MKLLQVEDLEKEYALPAPLLSRLRSGPPVVQALAGVSLEIERGETFGLVGESGSGKTTLVRLVLGLEPPTRGRVRFKGHDLNATDNSRLRQLRRYFQPVFQDPYTSLNPMMKVGAIVAEPLLIHKLGDRAERERRVAELLEKVGLDPAMAGRYPHEFSGGQRQRIAIARALSVEPELLVADEPVSALDVSVQSQILELFRELKRELGLTLLFVSHSLPVVRYLCDRVAVMHRGRVVELAGRDSIFEDARHPYTRRLLASTPLARRATAEGGVPPGQGELREVAPGHWVANSSA